MGIRNHLLLSLHDSDTSLQKMKAASRFPFEKLPSKNQTKEQKKQKTTIRFGDSLQLSDGTIGFVSKLFSDGTILLCDKKRFKAKDVKANLSIVTDVEKRLAIRTRFWGKGTFLEVYSESAKEWFSGKIVCPVKVHSNTKDVAHPTTWYQVQYFNTQKEKVQYKQLVWYSDKLRGLPDEISSSVSSFSDPPSE